MDETKASILIVDDNPVNRRILSQILTSHYPAPQQAVDGEECLSKLKQQHYDLVLLDLNMPSKSGIDVLREVDTLALASKPAFIMVSADNNPENISLAFNLGASDYVTTPFNRDELLARVSTHLTLRNRELFLEDSVAERTAELEASNRALQETQGQLLLSEKMASLGQLAAGVAHEINNPIGYIQSNLDSLSYSLADLLGLIEHYRKGETLIADKKWVEELKLKKDSINVDFLITDTKELIDDSLTGAQRVRQIVSDLKVFSHPAQNEWESVDITESINSVLNIVSSELKYKADIVLNIKEDLPKVQCVVNQLYQVLTNLLVNAAHSIEKYGTITIIAEVDEHNPLDLKVSVQDTGTGMTADVVSKVFDPFFTTKPVGEGTGLGLSVTFGIIEAHSGRINVESVPGHGSCFEIWLPINKNSGPQ